MKKLTQDIDEEAGTRQRKIGWHQTDRKNQAPDKDEEAGIRKR